MPHSAKEYASARFTTAQLIGLPLLFVAILFLGDRAIQWVAQRVYIDPPHYWPFSVFNPRSPRPLEWLAAVVSILVAGFGVRALARRGYPARWVTLLGLLLVLGTNAIQGVPRGFSYPVDGGIKGKEQYYHDAVRVGDTAEFLRTFNTIQPSLRIHSRTHPPGAVLLYYGLGRVTGERPALIGLGIALLATLIAAWAMPRFMANFFSAEPRFAGYASLLFLLLPAVQVYFCATLDAVIAALLLLTVTLYADSRGKGWRSALLASMPLTAVSFLTFGVAWVLPVLLVIDIQQKSWRRLVGLLPIPLLFYSGLYLLTGYDHLAALRLASHLENPEGFRLLAEPVTYVFTRLEDVAEILAFFGPFLLLLALRGLPILRQANSRTFALCLTAVGTLLGLFLTGAYHTGETARACLFLYPYLLLPVLALLQKANDREQQTVLALVFGQAILMQLWGNWFW